MRVDATAPLVRILERMSPAEAAAWLSGRPEEDAQRLVQAIATRPNAELPALLEELETANPEFTSLAHWLRGHPDWFSQVADELRRSAGILPAAGEAPGSPDGHLVPATPEDAKWSGGL